MTRKTKPTPDLGTHMEQATVDMLAVANLPKGSPEQLKAEQKFNATIRSQKWAVIKMLAEFEGMWSVNLPAKAPKRRV